MFLSAAEHTVLMDHINAFNLAYNWLARHALDEGHLLYKMTIKFHYVYHIADMNKWLNARYVWCYAFEDFMGEKVRSAQACVAGTGMHKLSTKFVDDMLLLLWLRIADAEF